MDDFLSTLGPVLPLPLLLLHVTKHIVLLVM
jgi:hypothetical protein